MIERNGKQILPKGETRLLEGDELILCGPEGGNAENGGMTEICLTAFHDWTDKRLSELGLEDELIVFIRRNGETLIPSGDTVLHSGDLLYVVKNQSYSEGI